MNKLHAALIAALAALGLAFATPTLAQKADAPKDAKAETKKADAPKDTKKAETPKADAKKADAKADAKKADAKADDKKAAAGALIDINSASEAELASLKGIGEARAKAIVKGRPYRGKNELKDKKIIPENVYNDIQDKIIAKQDGAAAAKKDAPKKDEKKDDKKK